MLKKAINFEIERQIDLLENGGKVVQETRLYDPAKDETRPCARGKKPTIIVTLPDPDLLPVILRNNSLLILQKTLPELPKKKANRFITLWSKPL